MTAERDQNLPPLLQDTAQLQEIAIQMAQASGAISVLSAISQGPGPYREVALANLTILSGWVAGIVSEAKAAG